jgi:hypothetical protein
MSPYVMGVRRFRWHPAAASRIRRRLSVQRPEAPEAAVEPWPKSKRTAGTPALVPRADPPNARVSSL